MRARWLASLMLACGPLPPAGSGGTTEGGGTAGDGDASSEGEVPTGGTTGSSAPTSMGETTGETTDETAGAPVIDCSQPVLLPDESVARAVRLSLGLPEGPVPVDRLADLVGLEVPSFLEVATLEGLQCFPNLVNVRLGSSSVSDLGPLAGMTKLEGIDVRSTALADLGPLATLPALQRLALQSDAVVDYAPLAGHPAMREMRVEGTTAVSLEPLAKIPNLWLVSLTACGLTDIAGLAGAGALVEVNVSDNQISDLSPLAGSTSLMTLYAYRNPLAGLTGLEELPALLELNVVETGLTELVAVAPDSLVWLVANDNNIADLSPLAGHVQLEAVLLQRNAVTSLAPIAQAPWAGDPCARLDVIGNPLDQETLEVVLPEICAFGVHIDTELAECVAMGDVLCDG